MNTLFSSLDFADEGLRLGLLVSPAGMLMDDEAYSGGKLYAAGCRLETGQ